MFCCCFFFLVITDKCNRFWAKPKTKPLKSTTAYHRLHSLKWEENTIKNIQFILISSDVCCFMSSSVNWTNLSHTLGSLFNFNASDNSHQVNAVTNACMITYVFQLWPWIAWLLNYSLNYFCCFKKINSLFQFSSCMICQIDFVDSKNEHCEIANGCIFCSIW